MTFFPMEEEKNLRLFMSVYLVGTALTFLGTFSLIMPVYQSAPYHSSGVASLLFGEERAPAALTAVAFAVFFFSSLGAASGKWTKPLLITAAVSFLTFDSAFIGFDTHVATLGRSIRIGNLVLPILFLFISTPKRILEMPFRSLREPAAPRSRFQTLLLIKLTIAIFYFANGIAKIRTGLRWADGATLQTVLLDAWIKRDNQIALAIANSDFLCQALTILVLGFELLAPVILFLPYGELVFVILGVSFHVAVFYFLTINFIFFPFLGAFAVFFRARWLARL